MTDSTGDRRPTADDVDPDALAVDSVDDATRLPADPSVPGEEAEHEPQPEDDEVGGRTGVTASRPVDESGGTRREQP